MSIMLDIHDGDAPLSPVPDQPCDPCDNPVESRVILCFALGAGGTEDRVLNIDNNNCFVGHWVNALYFVWRSDLFRLDGPGYLPAAEGWAWVCWAGGRLTITSLGLA